MSELDDIRAELRNIGERLKAVEELAKWTKFDLETEKAARLIGHNTHGSALDRLTDETKTLWQETAKIWLHFTPVMEKVFPGISADLHKISRFPETGAAPYHDPKIPGKKD